jgi:glycine/D-amino acid oxidase-like deaminating enzyme
MLLFDGQVLVDPPNDRLAQALGVQTQPTLDRYDVAVVGAGPAGLAAATYAASEGLRTLLLEREAVGGQAGTTSLIRNYLGFPRGISGAELAASSSSTNTSANRRRGRRRSAHHAIADMIPRIEDGHLAADPRPRGG